MKMNKGRRIKKDIKKALSALGALRDNLPHFLNLDYMEGDSVIFEDDSCGFYVGCYRKAFNININNDFKTVSIVPRTDDLYYYIYILGDYISTYDDNGTEHIEFKITGSLKSKDKIRVKGATFGANRDDNEPRPYETFIDEYMSKVDGVADLWKLEFWQNDFITEDEKERIFSWEGLNLSTRNGASVLPLIIKVLFDIIVKIIRLELTIQDNDKDNKDNSGLYRCDCEGLIEGLNENTVEEMLRSD